VTLEGMASGEVYSVFACRAYAGFRWSVETRHGTMNLDGIGLIAPAEEIIWADIWGLEGSPEGALP
jgi:hypothetical protein